MNAADSNNQFSLPAMGSMGSHTVSAQPDKGLRVYTLGRFTIVNDEQPLRYGRKSPGKPLQLLKALIAMGSRQVGAANLAEVLWPDKDGDLAQRSFDTTLHRLRRFLGDDRYLLMEDGNLTLNGERVWVDAWECERHMTRLRGLLSHHIDAEKAGEIDISAERVMRLYQGHFLSRELSTAWSVSMEERLRNRFIHTMLALGGFWEKQGLPARAIACYQKGIEVDDLVETFYQRLMLCFDRLGRQPEAIVSYRQCTHVLATVLGLGPTEETQRIYHSITRHGRQQAG